MIIAKPSSKCSSRLPVFIGFLLLVFILTEARGAVASENLQTHALLINGGGSRRINYQSHLLHVKRIYALLLESGVPAGNISILSADGSDPDTDLATREVQKEPEFWMLKGTRLEKALRPRIEYKDSRVEGVTLWPATRETLRQWFKTTGSSLAPGDTLLLYVTDHGSRNKKDLSNNTITLWGKDEELNVEELRELINMLNPSVKVVALMSQCYSGSFANLMYESAGDDLPRGNFSGFFSSTAGRPAYGCYPENRDKYNVGHSFRFLDALEAGGTFADAHTRVLVSDQTPDVPIRASDLYLEAMLKAEAESVGAEFDALVDRLLRSAWNDKETWEPEIRLLDRMGKAFGYFSPRFLSELGEHSDMLSQVSKQLDSYEAAWKAAHLSLNRANLDRFIHSSPDWGRELGESALKQAKESRRAALTRELLVDLAEYTKNDAETADRLNLLREKAEATRKASYRVQVRDGVVLRMRFTLINIAGRQYLSQLGTVSQLEAYSSLVQNEAFALTESDRSQQLWVDVEPFPPFDEELKLAEEALPGWMGIQFRPVTLERRDRHQLEDGAVTVVAVFPNSPALETGLEVGDIIVGPPGQPFMERDLVREWVMTAPIGESQPIQIQRGEDLMTLALTPRPYPRKWPSLPGPPKVGSPAPPLNKIQAFRGSPPIELTSGGPYLLFFWATWCGPCKAALPEIAAFESERNVPVLAITDEAAESVDAFLQKHEGPFPETVVLDEFRRSFLAYGVSGTPSFILVNAQGKVQSIKTGYRASRGLMIENWTWEGGEGREVSSK